MFAFGEFVLDPQLFQLRRCGEIVGLEPKVFDVLLYLVRHADRVVTRQELLASLWPQEVVTEAVLPANINVLRKALGQKRGERTPIETVHGRGYRLAMPVIQRHPSGPMLRVSERAVARVGERAITPTPSELELPQDASFVGRVSLLERLIISMNNAQLGQGQVCLLTGEAGVGKTRLASRVSEIARRFNADLWRGVCPEGVGTPTLWIWQQMVRCAIISEGEPLVRDWLGGNLESLLRLATEVSSPEGLLPDAGPSAEGAEEHDRATFRMLDATQRLLTYASASRLRVLVLEDMHRADLASWNVLRLLAPQLEKLSVLVIATLRGRDDLTVFEPVQKHVGELARNPSCQSIYVRGLSENESADLLLRVLGHPLSEQQVKKLHMKSGGNPLFLRELAEALAEYADGSGRIDEQALDDMQGFEPPEVVRNVLRRRVSRLGERAYQVLEAASVFASTWDAKNLERVTGMERPEVLSALDAATTQRIVVTMPGVDTYRFSHDLVRDTLRADLSMQAKKRFHLLAAAACEESLPWRGTEGIRELAHHLYQALPEGNPRVAIDWLTKAATHAQRRLDHHDAALLFRFALDAARFLPEPDPALQNRLRTALSQLGRT
ncbi:MAG: winged helix-turn-helix domain-containing protein [Myxococcales bacterium]